MPDFAVETLGVGMQTNPLLFLQPHIKEALDRYASEHIPPGSFLEACLCNDLKRALGAADLYHSVTIFAVVHYIYNHLPADSQGSREKYERWLQQ